MDHIGILYSIDNCKILFSCRMTIVCVWIFIVFRYAEYMLVNDVSNAIKIPDSLPLDVAAILPCGALAAYAAVQRVRPFVEDRLLNSSG